MQKAKIKVTHIFQILLDIFYGTLEVKRIKIRKNQIHHQKTTLKNNYYSVMIAKQKEDRILGNKSLTIKIRFSEEKC